MDVDFYIVGANEPKDGAKVACRLAEKAWSLGHAVYLHVEDDTAAHELDELLWTFRQESFVPHEITRDPMAPQPSEAPILIGARADVSLSLDVLINLTQSVPGFYAQAKRMAEIVAGDAAAQAAGRDRYRHYRDAGCTLRSHNV